MNKKKDLKKKGKTRNFKLNGSYQVKIEPRGMAYGQLSQHTCLTPVESWPLVLRVGHIIGANAMRI
jgi:hypothetical protein